MRDNMCHNVKTYLYSNHRLLTLVKTNTNIKVPNIGPRGTILFSVAVGFTRHKLV